MHYLLLLKCGEQLTLTAFLHTVREQLVVSLTSRRRHCDWNLLKEQGFKVWCCTDHVTDIVDGVGRSTCFVIFLTAQSMNRLDDHSQNCAKEFKLGVKQGLEWVVPVVLHKAPLNPKSWKGVSDYHLVLSITTSSLLQRR